VTPYSKLMILQKIDEGEDYETNSIVKPKLIKHLEDNILILNKGLKREIDRLFDK
jgi:hypothetical protein